MRKGRLLIAILAAVLAVSGCSGRTAGSQTTEAAKEAAEVMETEALSEGDSQAKTDKSSATKAGAAEGKTDAAAQDNADKQSEAFEVPDSEGEEKSQNGTEAEESEQDRIRTVIGTLEELTTDQIMLLSDNGNELTFAVNDAEIDLPAGIRVGNLVSVEYTGKITKKGAKKAFAVRIAGSADTVSVGGTEKETEETKSEPLENESETEKSAPAGKKKTLTGELIDLTMSTITVKSSDGKETTFRTINVPLYFKNGLSKGMSVSIVYRGTYEGSDAAVDSVEVKKIVNGE